MVNGPDGFLFDWDAVDWRACEEEVRRLRRRIFKASQEQDWAKARNLQKLMLRSWSNTLLGVRRVTQHNAGRRTAGVDGEVALTSSARARVAVRVHQSRASWKPTSVKRVYIPKAKGKRRPLGIPVLMDRCHQARVRNALEPEWEARFEPRSYGFRPGRSCHDAIQALHSVLANPGMTKRQWIVDADLAAAFDNIEHARLLAALGSFPAREMIRDWLKAGVFEKGKGFTPTVEGTPQGGVISPLLLNVALHGLEEAAGVRYRITGTHAGTLRPGSPAMVRYADDFIVCCHTRRQAMQVKARLAEWLTPRGLAFNEDKTRLVHLTEGFDFLGCNIRRYPNGKLLIKPSKQAVKRIRERLSTEMRSLRGSNAGAIIARLSPITRGWAAYYRAVVAKEIFHAVDHHMWKLTYKWAKHTHPKKPRTWVTARYFGKHNKFRNDRWVFGDPNSGAYLPKLAWTPIVRHTLVKGAASPDDPALTDYWAQRRKRIKPPLDDYTLRLLTRQNAACPLCGEPLLSADQPPQAPHEWERWWLQITRKAIVADYLIHHRRPGPPDNNHTRLVHAYCHRRLQARQRTGTAPSIL
jgi:RNA-directed DNA polymerase